MRVEHVDADGVVMLAEHVDGSRGHDGLGRRPAPPDRAGAPAAPGSPTADGSALGAMGTGAWRVSRRRHRDRRRRPGRRGRRPGRGDAQATGRGRTDVDAAPARWSRPTLTIVRSEPQPGPDGKLSTLSHVLASGMGVKALVAAPGPGTRRASRSPRRPRPPAPPRSPWSSSASPRSRRPRAPTRPPSRCPGEQDALVRAVAAAAPRTVVVVNAATPVLMPWADEVDAILVVGPARPGGRPRGRRRAARRPRAGRPAGHDVARGRRGRARLDGRAAPTSSSTTPTGRSSATAGSTPVGPTPPRTGSGAGEGYGVWDYAGAELVAQPRTPTAPPRCRSTVRNTADRDSRELVQVYFQPAEADQPVRLVGWATVDVAAGAVGDGRGRRPTPGCGAAGTPRPTRGRPWLRVASCSSPAASATSALPARHSR